MSDLGISLTLVSVSLIMVGVGIGYWIASKQFIKFYILGMSDGAASYEKAQMGAFEYAGLTAEQTERLHKETRNYVRRIAIEKGFDQSQN